MSDGQFLTLALVPVFTATLSLCGSALIVLDVLFDRQKRHSVYHRIMVVFSCFDMINSFSMVITTLPVPSDLDVLWAIGNEASCNFQAFIMQMGGSACFVYNATLTIYFVQVIRFHKNEAQLKRWEWCCGQRNEHCIPTSQATYHLVISSREGGNCSWCVVLCPLTRCFEPC